MNGSGGLNENVMNEWKKQSNLHSSIREILVDRLMMFPVSTVKKMTLQASTLSQLTQTNNQLTRITLVKHLSLSLSLFRNEDSSLFYVDELDEDSREMWRDHFEDFVDVKRDLVQ